MKRSDNHTTHRHYMTFILFIVVLVSSCGARARHEDMQKSFRKEIESIVKEYQFPGMTAAYILADGTIHVFASGFSDKEYLLPMTKASRMPAASIGKTFTGAEVLALVREGLLDLDVSVKKYLKDETWFRRLPNGSAITLRHLLTHSSGIKDHVYTKEFAGAFKKQRNTALMPRRLVSFVLDTPPLCRPGEEFHYSDTGYILAGIVIEKVTGRTFYEEITKRFLRPLDLDTTGPSKGVFLPGIASGYLTKDNILGLPGKTTLFPGVMAWDPGIEGSGGGFVSTPEDLAVWAKTFYEGNALPGNYMEDVTQSITVRENVRYGIATVIQQAIREGVSYGHSGWIPGYCSNVRYYQKYKTAIAFQINTDIGIVGSKENVLHNLETRLAQTVLGPSQIKTNKGVTK